MPKIRTNKTAAKRFKISGTGKIIRTKAYNSHQFLHKSGSQKRRLEQEPELFRGEQKRVRRLLVMAQPKSMKAGRPVKVVDREARRAEDRSKLVAMVTRSN